jgi:hypothetical protein
MDRLAAHVQIGEVRTVADPCDAGACLGHILYTRRRGQGDSVGSRFINNARSQEDDAAASGPTLNGTDLTH